MKRIAIVVLTSLCFSCGNFAENEESKDKKLLTKQLEETALVVLGTAQDAGSPQINCTRKCCSGLYENNNNERKVVALGLYDGANNKSFLIEASPDIGDQLFAFNKILPTNNKNGVDGILLTHAHIGHYSGLMYLGKEALGSKKVPVFAMPKMESFLTTNGPWSQLVNRKNIIINQLKADSTFVLSKELSVVPFLVPHRDEYSETVGYKIIGPKKSALFIPDIDKWGKWEKDIVKELSTVDYAFLDATFFDGEEINHRDITEIPHPFIIESMKLFENIDQEEKAKIYFIHFNHTNPVLIKDSKQTKKVEAAGFNIARKGMIFNL